MDYVERFTEMAIGYVPLVIGALITLIVGFLVAGWVARLVKRRLERRDADPTIIPFMTSLTSITIKVLTLLSTAAIFGLEVTSFIAILGSVAFAIGLALQGTLGHMAAGILILFFKPFKVDDFIVSQGYSGTVKTIELFVTTLTTLDNRIIILPNGGILSNPLENLTANDVRKVPMTFGVGYDDDIDKVRKVLQSVADSCPQVLHDQPVDILVTEHGESSVNFAVRPWCKTEDYWTVFAYMHEEVKKAFDKEGINIPYPQMDVHMPEKAN